MDYHCYVVHVKKGYEERERSIVEQFARLGLEFEWLLDYDIPDLTPELLRRYGYQGNKLRPAEISCSLKHIAAWERIAASARPGALVFEDDVLLDRRRFQAVAAAAIAEFSAGSEAAGYLSLGDGCALYVPWTKLRRGRYLYQAEQVRATDSYFLTRTAAVRMLELVGREGFYLPADHLINRLCHQLSIPILWVSPTVVSQGSHTGRFASQIQTWDRGEFKEKVKWLLKKFRRKYLYPLRGEDPRRISPQLRADLNISCDK
ncbi:MAG: glycosyltransferase family 25 protein [Desulfobulbaceae bacterium]|nr:glycosyltransferase family 25 protein [Desulfobulbaceae bacterium]